MRLSAGLVLAALSTGALNWGFFAQHRAAGRMPRLTLLHPVRSVRALVGGRMWLAGYLTGLWGWGLYIIALVFAPLSIVQATSAGGIGLLAVFVSRVEGVSLGRAEKVGVGAAVLGLALLGLSMVGRSPQGGHGALMPVLAWVGVCAAGAAVALGPARGVLSPGGGYGAAAGLLYAAGDVATKAAVAGGARLGLLAVVAACHGSAFVLIQLGFQRGSALSTAGLSTVLTNALPIGAGVVLFHEALPGGVHGVARVAAFLAVVAGAAFLARSDRVREPVSLVPSTLQPGTGGRNQSEGADGVSNPWANRSQGRCAFGGDGQLRPLGERRRAGVRSHRR